MGGGEPKEEWPYHCGAMEEAGGFVHCVELHLLSMVYPKMD